MAIIAIISIGVYNAYLLLIRQTKAGQVKQTATLIGKQISEEIKSASENKDMKTSNQNNSVILPLTNNIYFTQDGENYISPPQYFNEEGNLGNDKDRYKAEIELLPKKTDKNNEVSIDEFFNNENADIDDYTVYLINENAQAKLVDAKPDSSSNIEENKTVKIEITEKNDNATGQIATDTSSLDYTFNKEKIQINMDLQYCTGVVTIRVDNETKVPLNLCILNNNDAIVDNQKGTLYEYYRSEAGSKIGTLYDVNIKIFDEKGDKSKPIFQTNFVQNININ